jgi:hypothetical protein
VEEKPYYIDMNIVSRVLGRDRIHTYSCKSRSIWPHPSTLSSPALTISGLSDTTLRSLRRARCRSEERVGNCVVGSSDEEEEEEEEGMVL